MKNTKYTDEEVQDELNYYSLHLDKYVNAKNVYAHDDIGYKYHFSLSNLRMGRKPDWLQRNPFALENIKLYLSINHPDYELLDDRYVSCKEKMSFICHKHVEKGEQINSIDNIVHSHHACKYCGYSVLSELKRLPDAQLKEMCKERGVIYIGRKQYDRQTHIIYKCPKHTREETQEMSLYHFRASNVPCHFCQITSGELRVKKFLDENRIDYVFQYVFSDCKHIRALEFDFYLPKMSIAIEYDGKQHFQPMNYAKTKEENERLFELCQKRDEIKNIYCNENGITLIRIPYWEYENIEMILMKELLHINIESSETAG